jgi:hypothetical protein
MQYKTIVLGLLEQNPQMYRQLRKNRKLLPALEIYAQELKTSHEAWKNVLSGKTPDSDPSQVASEALEMALKDLEDHLPSASRRNDRQAVSLDAAMAFIRHHTPRG